MGMVGVTEVRKGQKVRVKTDRGPVKGEVETVEQRERAGEQIVLVTVFTANGGFTRAMYKPGDKIEVIE